MRIPLTLLVAIVVRGAPLPAQSFANFEGPQSRSVAISPDAQRLFAVNTPDQRLAIYSIVDPRSPVLLREVTVGIEPVSVAARSNAEVWVVNHVSDSISVVDVARGVVVATVRVGDEPGDVVFAGNPQRAFVSSMTERSVSVIDPATRRKLGEIPVFGDDPRAMLASRDGRTVWVAIGRSGNRTTIVPHTIAPAPPPPTNRRLPPAPKQGILVDSEDPVWKPRLGVQLPDLDVVEIDVASQRVRRSYPSVGTMLFGLAMRPGRDELWVANTEARNLVRFETALRGHVIDSRITKISLGATPTITPVDLNPGIDYTKLPNPAALSRALSQPTDVVFAPDGKLAYVAAFGTDRIGVLNPTGQVQAVIEVGDTPGTRVAPRTKRGPRALAHHPAQPLLYVLNRLSNSVSVIETTSRRVLREIAMFDPTPRELREGRGFLYDAKLSGNGTASCAACHIDGRTDGVAWDLGDPGGAMFSNGSDLLHPMKGPLLTQTLQGLAGERIFHWRADRPGLASFNGTFATLLGGSTLASADMNTFANFMANIRFMPNPNRNRDDSLPDAPIGESARNGELLFRTKADVGRDRTTTFRCIGCHTNSSGTGGFGFQGLIEQPMKVAQLRGLYKRDGRKQVRGQRTAGFGYGVDGSKDDLEAFLSTTLRFNPLTAAEKRALRRFLFAFPAGDAPSVGFSRTVDASTWNTAASDIALLVAQAVAGKCDLIVRGTLGLQRVGFSYDAATRRFQRDRASLPPLDLAQLRAALAPAGSLVTFEGVPLGQGRRLGIDRDDDGILDGDEGLVRYGAPSPACATPLVLDANSVPRIGDRGFALVASGVPGRRPGWLLLAGGRASSRVVDLELLVDLGSLVLVPMSSDSRGVAVLPLPLPDDAALIGTKLATQGVFAVPCGRLGAAASAALEVVLQR